MFILQGFSKAQVAEVYIEIHMLQRKQFACARQVETVQDTALQNKQKGRISILFSLIKQEKVRKYILISQFSTEISAVDFRLYLKNCYCYFRVTFSKTWLLAYFYVVADVDDFGRIYTSLVAQR